MKEKKSEPLNAPTFTSKDVAELAATFLPPLPLTDDWRSLSAKDLQQGLASEFLPGGNATMSPKELYKRQEELFLDPLEERHPSVFEVLAEAAVKRARILLSAAEGKKREERLNLEYVDGKISMYALAEEKAEKQALEEYRKKFGDRERVSLDEAVRVIFNNLRSKKIRDGLVQKWISLTDEERKEHGFDLEPTFFSTFQEKGVLRLDYPYLKRDLLWCKELYYDAVRKEIQRDSGKKGGKKSQEKSRKTQGVASTADPSKPTQKLRRGG